MKVVLFLFVFNAIIVGVCFAANPTPPPPPPQYYDFAREVPGFEVIFSNTSSFLDEINLHREEIYVAGQGLIHSVGYEPFEFSHWPWFFSQHHSFVDFQAFTDSTNSSWAVGPIPNQFVFNDNGMNYPLYITGKAESAEPPPGHYVMASVAVDAYPGQPITAFFAGWHQHINASDGVNFTVIRSKVLPQNAVSKLGPVFEYNYTGHDRVALHGNGFVAFDRLFKPWIFHSATYHHLVVVDPASNTVYRIGTDPELPLLYNNSMRAGVHWGQITGATYDRTKHHAYVGVQGWGSAPGRIVVVDVFTMTIIRNHSLAEWESNPTSLSLDAANNLYVGLLGGHAILKINLATWATVGYATLPTYLRQVNSIIALPVHVYFVTYEQHSKVGRVSIKDFCSTPCDGLVGYCNGGTCACPKGYHLGPDKRRCELPTETPGHKDKGNGGEIALGILFALVTIIAAAGWFIVYRGKRGEGYKALLG